MEHIEEGFKDTKLGQKSTELGNKLNNGLNNVSHAAATRITRTPSSNEQSAYDRYRRNFNRWKTAIKGAGVVTALMLTPKPFDIALGAALIGCVQNSKDPVDVSITNFLKTVSTPLTIAREKLATAIKKVKDDAKDKKLTESDAEKKISMLDTLATNYTKMVDNTNQKIENMRGKKSPDGDSNEKKVVKESADIQELVKDILYDNGEITLESYDAVSRFIDKADYNNDRDVLISEACIDLLMNDCGF